MPLRLVSDKERLTYSGADWEVYYRRLPSHIRGQIIQKRTKRGETNWSLCVIDFLEYSILGWKGFEFELDDGTLQKDTPYEMSLVRRIPEDEQAVLLELIGANIGGGEGDDLKNSPTSPDNKLPLTDGTA